MACARPGFGVEDFQRRVSWRLRPSRHALRAVAARLASRRSSSSFRRRPGWLSFTLRQQMIARLDHAHCEHFFDSARRSSVNKAIPSRRALRSAPARSGFSLLFSATITCASTIWSAWRQRRHHMPAFRSQKASSKLPRRVLPSTAIARSPSGRGRLGERSTRGAERRSPMRRDRRRQDEPQAV